jgi:hypothetical protein
MLFVAIAFFIFAFSDSVRSDWNGLAGTNRLVQFNIIISWMSFCKLAQNMKENLRD